MKKVVLATLLAVASIATMPHSALAQAGTITLPPAENTAYSSAIAITDPKAKATALEQFLTTFPSSQVKLYVLQQLAAAYSTFDAAKTLDASDRLLQMDSNNLEALTFEAYLRRAAADTLTDATQKQAGLDAAAGFAQRGLDTTKPKDVNDADFTKQKAQATWIFEGVLANDALGKKDSAAAIKDFKAELESVPVDQTKANLSLLQDTFNLAQAYYQTVPPDYLDCAWYTTRASDFSPEPYKTTMAKFGSYCYKKYHGGDDGYDALVAATQTSLEPPAGLFATIKAAPTPAEQIAAVIASTPDLSVLNFNDREAVLQYGKPEDVAKMWDVFKGKSVQLDGIVIAATPTQLQVAVSEDAVNGKTADFTVNLKPIEPPAEPSAKATPAQKAAYKRAVAEAAKTAADVAAATTVGSKINMQGTYASYTTNPVMFTMSDGEVILPKAAPKPGPRRAARR